MFIYLSITCVPGGVVIMVLSFIAEFRLRARLKISAQKKRFGFFELYIPMTLPLVLGATAAGLISDALITPMLPLSQLRFARLIAVCAAIHDFMPLPRRGSWWANRRFSGFVGLLGSGGIP
jgi:hypothetical protein